MSSNAKKHLRSKGNKKEETKMVIPFYTKKYFETKRSEKDADSSSDEKSSGNAKTVKFTIKIDPSIEEDDKTNITYYALEGISHFDSNPEEVFRVMDDLMERVIPGAINDTSRPTIIDKFVSYLTKSTTTSNANTTLQKCLREARKQTMKRWVNIRDDERIVVAEDEDTPFSLEENDVARFAKNASLFKNWLDRPVSNQIDARELVVFDQETGEDLREWSYEMYLRNVRNEINKIIFGNENHKAYENQKEYMTWEICKPYGVPASKGFRRIDYLVNLMKWFPPPTGRDEEPTDQQWNTHEEVGIKDLQIRKMKFNLLPEGFQYALEQLEEDWRTMDEKKFLSQTTRIEARDFKDREMAKNKIKKKRDRDQDIDDRKHARKSSRSSKHTKTKERSKSKSHKYKATAMFCWMCEAAGYKEWVYQSHNPQNCKNLDKHKRLLGSNAGRRHEEKSKARREIRAYEKGHRRYKKEAREYRTRKYNPVFKRTKRTKRRYDEKKTGGLRKKSAWKDDESSSSSSSSDSESDYDMCSVASDSSSNTNASH